MSAVLEVKNLSVTLNSGAQEKILLRSLNFSVRQGEVLGILGQSGSGKSLTSLALAGLLPSGMTSRGSILFFGQEINGIAERELVKIRGKISIVFQEPSAALDPLMRLGKQIALPLKKHAGLRGAALKEAVYSLLREVKLTGIPRVAHSYPHEVSGGQRQRAAVALALAPRPRLLVADEPTSALDARTQVKLAELIAGEARTRRMAVIFISHDIGVLAKISDNIIVMKDGRIVEAAPAPQLLSAPKHPYSKLLIESALSLEEPLSCIIQTKEAF
ncbi:MAG: ABC transporter ATP-binding protein [Spirochaetaceae bacterium]|jgi:peptide/nickel transport system ATP-binding protein|nr:ABC transporter ATP-binding protein [Spirochaetaceae bacterium]